MMVIITYDVNTETAAGRKRLRHVAKQCVNYGQRVQNSVFECVASPAQLCEIKAKLEKIIDKDYKEQNIKIAFHPIEEKFETLSSAIEKDFSWI